MKRGSTHLVVETVVSPVTGPKAGLNVWRWNCLGASAGSPIFLAHEYGQFCGESGLACGLISLSSSFRPFSVLHLLSPQLRAFVLNPPSQGGQLCQPLEKGLLVRSWGFSCLGHAVILTVVFSS